MKRTFALLLTAVTLLSILSGCSKKQEEVKTLKFGLLSAESAIPIIVAKEKGFFEEEGVPVELVAFPSPNERNTAVQANELDGTIADVMTALNFNDGGFPMVITSDINEDFKLLTSPNSGIDSFEKLDKKDISIVPNFVLEYIMDEMAKKNGITYEIVSIPSFTARFEALLADQISGVIFTEPQAGMLVAQGAHQLASSKEYGIKAGTLMFNKETLDKYPGEVENFYKAYNKAVDYINSKDASEYSDLLGDYGFPDAIAGYLSSGIQFEKAGKITPETFDSVLTWTKEKSLVKNDYKYEDVCDFKYIE